VGIATADGAGVAIIGAHGHTRPARACAVARLGPVTEVAVFAARAGGARGVDDSEDRITAAYLAGIAGVDFGWGAGLAGACSIAGADTVAFIAIIAACAGGNRFLGDSCYRITAAHGAGVSVVHV